VCVHAHVVFVQERGQLYHYEHKLVP